MLEFSWPAFAFAVVNFLILVGLLYRFLHKPVLRVLEERRKGIAEAREAAQKEADEARKVQRDYEKKLADIQEERDRQLSEARRTTEQAREEILAKAREDAKREVENLRGAFERERQDALEDLRDDIADLAVTVADSILRKTVDTGVDSRLNALLAEELEAMAGEDGPASAGEEAPIRVTSARELSADDRERLLKALGRPGADDKRVEFEVDEALLAGSRVEFSDKAVDSSLAEVLEDIRKAAAEDAEAGEEGAAS